MPQQPQDRDDKGDGEPLTTRPIDTLQRLRSSAWPVGDEYTFGRRRSRARTPAGWVVPDAFGALWSERHRPGGAAGTLTVQEAARLFALFVEELQEADRLQEWFGYDCVDDGTVPGRFGKDPATAIEMAYHVRDVWPPRDHWQDWDQHKLFDAIELFGRHVSTGNEGTGRWHDYGGCGWHFKDFDPSLAFAEYSDRVNPMLARLGDGFVLTEDGQVGRLAPAGMAGLLEVDRDAAQLSEEGHIAQAIGLFERPGLDSKRESVRVLADLLEARRSEVRQHLHHEGDRAIFQIANSMWIRHNRDDQVRDYDHDAWWDWIFWFYLASLRLLQKLEAHALGTSGEVAELILDLDGRSSFRSGDLSRRLRAIGLADVPHEALENLGIAVGRRAYGGTFTVRNDGVLACSESADLAEWPPAYRVGVVAGLFLGSDGRLLVPGGLAAPALYMLGPVGDLPRALELVEQIHDAPVTAAAARMQNACAETAIIIRQAKATVAPQLAEAWE